MTHYIIASHQQPCSEPGHQVSSGWITPVWTASASDWHQLHHDGLVFLHRLIKESLRRWRQSRCSESVLLHSSNLKVCSADTGVAGTTIVCVASKRLLNVSDVNKILQKSLWSFIINQFFFIVEKFRTLLDQAWDDKQACEHVQTRSYCATPGNVTDRTSGCHSDMWGHREEKTKQKNKQTKGLLVRFNLVSIELKEE